MMMLIGIAYLESWYRIINIAIILSYLSKIQLILGSIMMIRSYLEERFILTDLIDSLFILIKL